MWGGEGEVKINQIPYLYVPVSQDDCIKYLEHINKKYKKRRTYIHPYLNRDELEFILFERKFGDSSELNQVNKVKKVRW